MARLNSRLRPRLGRLRLRGFSLTLGYQTRIEDCFTIRRRVKATVEVEIRPLEAQPRLLADPLQGFQRTR
jgi:hypothetical protein